MSKRAKEMLRLVGAGGGDKKEQRNTGKRVKLCAQNIDNVTDPGARVRDWIQTIPDTGVKRNLFSRGPRSTQQQEKHPAVLGVSCVVNEELSPQDLETASHRDLIAVKDGTRSATTTRVATDQNLKPSKVLDKCYTNPSAIPKKHPAVLGVSCVVNEELSPQDLETASHRDLIAVKDGTRSATTTQVATDQNLKPSKVLDKCYTNPSAIPKKHPAVLGVSCVVNEELSPQDLETASHRDLIAVKDGTRSATTTRVATDQNLKPSKVLDKCYTNPSAIPKKHPAVLGASCVVNEELSPQDLETASHRDLIAVKDGTRSATTTRVATDQNLKPSKVLDKCYTNPSAIPKKHPAVLGVSCVVNEELSPQDLETASHRDLIAVKDGTRSATTTRVATDQNLKPSKVLDKCYTNPSAIPKKHPAVLGVSCVVNEELSPQDLETASHRDLIAVKDGTRSATTTRVATDQNLKPSKVLDKCYTNPSAIPKKHPAVLGVSCVVNEELSPQDLETASHRDLIAVKNGTEAESLIEGTVVKDFVESTMVDVVINVKSQSNVVGGEDTIWDSDFDPELQMEWETFEAAYGGSVEGFVAPNVPAAVETTPELNSPEPRDKELVESNTPARSSSPARRRSRHMEPKESARKRSRNMFKWKSTLAKAALAKGLEHLNLKGKLIRGRKMGPGCGMNCRFKCHQNITKNHREAIFCAFWKIVDHSRKWDFINKYTTITSPKERKKRGDSPARERKHTRAYHFNIGDKIVKVCRSMFLSTLDISEQFLKTATAKMCGNHAISPDKRGKHGNHKVTPPQVKQSVRDHINSMPRVPSHYCRARSKREYLEAGLSVTKLHDKYLTWMNETNPGEAKATKRTYQDIFNCEFNISFHQPKKDQCDLCLTYEKKLNQHQKIKRKAEYDLHIKRKDEAREKRNEDRARAQSDPKVCFATFDLQKVLSCPKDKGGAMFYVSKLSVYNFTVWDAIRREGFCYVWHEGEAQRGANEVASGVLLFIDYMVRNHNTGEFLFWSDNCSGQNKNKFLFSMYTYASAKYGVKISHRYLEKGHTENAGDCMHSCIERFAKEKRIYSPEEWYDTIRHSSTKTEYRIDENNKKISEKVPAYKLTKLGQLVFDFHEIANELQKWTGHRQVQWKHVRDICVSDCKKPQNVSVKHDFNAQSVDINVTKQRLGRPLKLEKMVLKRAYDGPIQIKAKKLGFLWKLCKDFIIPLEYHEFYKSLVGFPDLSIDEEAINIPENLNRIASENDLAELLDEMREDDIDLEAWLVDDVEPEEEL